MSIGILAVDPGLMTGICFMSWSGNSEEDPVLEMSVEADEESYAAHIDSVLAVWKKYDNFYVICERFTINAQTVRNSQAPYSLEQIGILKHLCRTRGYEVSDIRFQMPADAKNMFPNKSLKILGFWHVGGAGHALDAIRHGLLGAARLRWIPRALLNQN
jgi:hypothetical protein